MSSSTPFPTSPPSSTLDSKYLHIPTSSDPKLPNLLQQCGLLFRQLRHCIDTAHIQFQSTSTSTSTSTPSSSSSSLEWKKEKTKYIIQSCGYLRGPVRQCILNQCCEQEKTERDVYLMEPKFNPNEAIHLDLQLSQCIRQYQAAMMVAWDPLNHEFKLHELDELK